MVRGDVFSAALFAKSAAEFLFSVVLFSESAAESAPPAVGLPGNGVYAPDFPAPAAVPWAVSVRFREAGTPFCGDSRAKYSANFVKNSRTRYILRPFLCPRWLLLGGNVASTPQNSGLRTGKKVKKEEKFWQKMFLCYFCSRYQGCTILFLPGGAEIIPLYLNRVMPA